MTSIGTAVGWLSLATVLDLYSRRVVGWAMAVKQDEMLVHQALALAVAHRNPEAGLLHHSARGCQYTSQAYQTSLQELDIRVSMSRKGKGFR